MDTTKYRVSEPAFKILQHFHTGETSFDKIKNIVSARRGMLRCTVRASNIEVSLSKNPVLRAVALSRLNEENADLKATGAYAVLNGKGWPCELLGV